MNLTLVNLAYLSSAILFILGLKGLTHPRTALRGNLLGALGMLLAIVTTLFFFEILELLVEDFVEDRGAHALDPPFILTQN